MSGCFEAQRKICYCGLSRPVNGVPHEALNALQQIVEKDRNEAVRQAVKLLPEDDRVLVWMYYFDEMSIKELQKW